MAENYDEIILKLNAEYVGITNSAEYRVGKYFRKAISIFKHEPIKAFRSSIKEYIIHTKIKKYKKFSKRFKPMDRIQPQEKIAVYTIIFGNYDSLLDPIVVDSMCDYYVITDQNCTSKIWKKIDVDISSFLGANAANNILKNRYGKLNPETIFPDYKYTMYIDGNLQLYGKPSDFICYINETTGLALFNHATRICIYDEGEVCKIVKRSVPRKVNQQLDKYRSEGMPKNFGMCECNVILRKNTSESNAIMHNWWSEFLNSNTLRDQLAFPYVLWRIGYTIKDIGCLGDDINCSAYFRRITHIKSGELKQ